MMLLHVMFTHILMETISSYTSSRYFLFTPLKASKENTERRVPEMNKTQQFSVECRPFMFFLCMQHLPI